MKIDVVMWREGTWLVVKSPKFGTTTQGRTLREAINNFKEAFELSLEDDEFKRMVARVEEERPIQTLSVSAIMPVACGAASSSVSQDAQTPGPFRPTSN